MVLLLVVMLARASLTEANADAGVHVDALSFAWSPLVPPAKALECSAPDGSRCTNLTVGSGCDSPNQLCTCQIGGDGGGFVCGRTCNGPSSTQPCSPDIADLFNGCPSCCSSALFNTSKCAVCYEEQCTFDCDAPGRICSAQCVEHCVFGTQNSWARPVHPFSATFWGSPFKNGTCMADCWRGNWVASVKESFMSVSTTFGVVVPYLFRFIADFAWEIVLDQMGRLTAAGWAFLALIVRFVGAYCSESPSADKSELSPLLPQADAESTLERGVSISGPALRHTPHPIGGFTSRDDDEEEEREEKCLMPCSKISCCSSQGACAYARCAKVQVACGVVALILTIADFVLQIVFGQSFLTTILSKSLWDEIVLFALWGAYIVLRVAMWTPKRAKTVYAPGSKTITVMAAPGFTMYDLQGHHSTWDEAVDARGFSQGDARWHAAKRFVFWHLSQPGMYAVVLYVYWSSLLQWQKAVASLVAVRELFYVLLLMLSTWYIPAFLLVDIAQSMGSLHDSLHPINGWFCLIIYVFAPEKFVVMALLQRQDKGHDNHSCLSTKGSPYVRPRNQQYRSEGSGRGENYLPRWVKAAHLAVVVWIIALLDAFGCVALILNYIPALRKCEQFRNTVEGGQNVPAELFNGADPCGQDVSAGAVSMDASQCALNSKTMIDDSQGLVWCRYTTWPDALLFSYWVTVLSGFVMILFSVYRHRWCFPVERQELIKDSETGEMKWVLQTSRGEYLDVDSGKLLTVSQGIGGGRVRGSKRSHQSSGQVQTASDGAE